MLSFLKAKAAWLARRRRYVSEAHITANLNCHPFVAQYLTAMSVPSRRHDNELLEVGNVGTLRSVDTPLTVSHPATSNESLNRRTLGLTRVVCDCHLLYNSNYPALCAPAG